MQIGQRLGELPGVLHLGFQARGVCSILRLPLLPLNPLVERFRQAIRHEKVPVVLSVAQGTARQAAHGQTAELQNVGVVEAAHVGGFGNEIRQGRGKHVLVVAVVAIVVQEPVPVQVLEAVPSRGLPRAFQAQLLLLGRTARRDGRIQHKTANVVDLRKAARAAQAARDDFRAVKAGQRGRIVLLEKQRALLEALQVGLRDRDRSLHDGAVPPRRLDGAGTHLEVLCHG